MERLIYKKLTFNLKIRNKSLSGNEGSSSKDGRQSDGGRGKQSDSGSERSSMARRNGEQEQEHGEERAQQLAQEGVLVAYQLLFSSIQRLFYFGVLSGTHHTTTPSPKQKIRNKILKKEEGKNKKDKTEPIVCYGGRNRTSNNIQFA